MDLTYVEIAGGDHVLSITRNARMIAGVFDFFDAKRRAPATKAGAVPAASKTESPPKAPAETRSKRTAALTVEDLRSRATVACRRTP